MRSSLPVEVNKASELRRYNIILLLYEHEYCMYL